MMFHASQANAAKVTNLDKQTREFTVIYLGGDEEKITLQPNASASFYGVGNELRYGKTTQMVHGTLDEYVISNNFLVINRRVDRPSRGF